MYYPWSSLNAVYSSIQCPYMDMIFSVIYMTHVYVCDISCLYNVHIWM